MSHLPKKEVLVKQKANLSVKTSTISISIRLWRWILHAQLADVFEMQWLNLFLVKYSVFVSDS